MKYNPYHIQYNTYTKYAKHTIKSHKQTETELISTIETIFVYLLINININIYYN